MCRHAHSELPFSLTSNYFSCQGHLPNKPKLCFAKETTQSVLPGKVVDALSVWLIGGGGDYHIKTDLISVKKYSQAVDISANRIFSGVGVGNGERLLTVSGSASRCSHYDKSAVVPQKARNRSAM